MSINNLAKITTIAIACIACSAPSRAAPLAFDCDAPANVVSSVQNLAQTMPSISGVIDPKRARSGNILPTVGAQIFTPDGNDTVGFALTLRDPQAMEMDIAMIISRDGQNERRDLGKVDLNTPIPFRLFVDRAGMVTMFIRERSWSEEIGPLVGGTEKAFCSTGQFGINDLRFSD